MAVEQALHMIGNPSADDEETRRAFNVLKLQPITEDGAEWVRIASDHTLPRERRRMAFVAFFSRFVVPPTDLHTIFQKYNIDDWFVQDSVGDWTNSDGQSLLSEFRNREEEKHKDFGIYAVVFEGNWDGPLVCFGTDRHMATNVLCDTLRRSNMNESNVVNVVAISIEWLNGPTSQP